MTDLLHHRLSAARPGEDELAHLWPLDARAELLDRIMATDTGHRVRRHRRRASVVLVAAAASAAVVLPATVDPPNAAAADLRVLALSAASYDGPVLREGSWLHEQSTDLQRNSPTLSDGAVYDHDRETWTRWDGRLLLVEHSPSGGWTSYDVIDGAHEISDLDAPAYDDPASYQDPTPRFAATLPDDAPDLLAYLDGRVLGSSSHQEALFDALVDLATSHTLPPRTLAATFEALGEMDGVRTDDALVQGRPAVEVSFRDEVTSSTETMVVDRATGQVLSSHDHSEQSDYTSTTTFSEVVAQVPSDVLEAFAGHEEGVRYDASGAVVTD